LAASTSMFHVGMFVRWMYVHYNENTLTVSCCYGSRATMTSWKQIRQRHLMLNKQRAKCTNDLKPSEHASTCNINIAPWTTMFSGFYPNVQKTFAYQRNVKISMENYCASLLKFTKTVIILCHGPFVIYNIRIFIITYRVQI